MAKNHYVDNKKFLEALIVYREDYMKLEKHCTGKEKPNIKIPEYIGVCVMEIAQNLAKKPNFSGYDFLDEMIFDAIENSLKYAHKFNPEKSSNPFAYFTQITYYAFLRRIEKEKQKLYVQLKLQEHFFQELESDPEFKGKKYQTESEKLFHDGMVDFMEKFEEKNKTVKKEKVYPSNPLSELFDE